VSRNSCIRLKEGHCDSASDQLHCAVFIVRDVRTAIAFYRDQLGFDVMYQLPEPDVFLRACAAAVRW
jgi:hypothetical protein